MFSAPKRLAGPLVRRMRLATGSIGPRVAQHFTDVRPAAASGASNSAAVAGALPQPRQACSFMSPRRLDLPFELVQPNHVDARLRAASDARYEVASVTFDSKHVHIEWRDGHRSSLLQRWLCDNTFHPSTTQRVVDSLHDLRGLQFEVRFPLAGTEYRGGHACSR